MNKHVPKVGLVSLGCPKALVDSERIITQLRAEGYVMSPGYADADVVLVNTCGFLDSAKAESLAAIGEAMADGHFEGLEIDLDRRSVRLQLSPGGKAVHLGLGHEATTKRCGGDHRRIHALAVVFDLDPLLLRVDAHHDVHQIAGRR